MVTGAGHPMWQAGSPRSWTWRVSLAENGGVAGVSWRLVGARVNVAGRLPPLVMLTAPELEPPGFNAFALRIELPGTESVIVSVPAVIRLPGVAEVELKLAAEPTATAVASIRPPSAVSSRCGEAVTIDRGEIPRMSTPGLTLPARARGSRRRGRRSRATRTRPRARRGASAG